MTIRFLLALGSLLLTACVSSNEKSSDLEWQRLQEPLRHESRLKAEFAARYKSYRCEEADLPTSELSKPSAKFRSIQLGDRLLLKLKLGKLTRLNGPTSGGPMRTESRYELYWDGQLVSKAESLFSNDEILSSEGPTLLAYHSPSQSLLVFEELAWTTQRYIVFESTKGLDATSQWTAKHFELPARERYQNPTVERGQFRSFGNGRVYLEIDGLLYAFPVDDFLVGNLDFTVG